MNASLQALASVPGFVNALMRAEPRIELKTNQKKRTADETDVSADVEAVESLLLAEDETKAVGGTPDPVEMCAADSATVLKGLFHDLAVGGDAMKLDTFRKFCGTRKDLRKFADAGFQQDAEEFIGKLFLVTNDIFSTRTVALSSAGDSFIRALFEIVVEKTIHCNSKPPVSPYCAPRKSTEAYYLLVLYPCECTSLEAQFKQYMAPTTMGDGTKDQSGQMNGHHGVCGVMMEERKKITTWPAVLVFKLARSSYDLQSQSHIRLTSPISFPEALSGEYLGVDDMPAYALCAIINNRGSPLHPEDGDRGHYTTVCKRGNEWYWANDGKITPTVCPEESNEALILFYVRA
jgi:hypothetical protein